MPIIYQHHLEHATSAVLLGLKSIPSIGIKDSLPRLYQRSKGAYIALAIGLFVATKIYRGISNPSLKHIAHVPIRAWIGSLMRGESSVERARKLLVPCATETNGFVAVLTPLGWEVKLMNPYAIKTFLQKTETFPKSVATSDSKILIRRFFGETNLALANGHEWKRRRKIANPAFHRSMPIKLFSNLASKALEQIDTTEGPVHVNNLMTRVTLDAIGLAGFGFNLNAISTPDGEWVDAYVDVAEHLLEFPYIFLPILETRFLNLFPKHRARHEKLTKLNCLFDDIIKHKRENLGIKNANLEDSEKDLLTLLMEAGRGEDDDSEPLNDSELRDELVIYFFAGHDTTACTLTAALYYLAANTDIQTKARQEALDVIGDEAGDLVPTAEQLKNLPYLSKVMKETVRMASPTINLISRKATKDTELDGMVIPKGTRVTVDIAAIHYNDKVWENPQVFDPERFADGGEYESMPSKYLYLPFGGGSRQCIGMNFSLAEQRVLLTAILRKYDISLPKDSIHRDGLLFNSHLLVLSSKDVTLEFKPRY